MRRFEVIAMLLSALPLAGCQTPEPLHTMPQIDLQRFMGDWYVIANIPSFIERGAHNAVESYRLADDGRVLTDFTFNKGAFDGPRKHYEPVGYVSDDSNAVWGMQFIWPVKAEYRIMFVDPEYAQTIVGRSKRDYVWIMARTPAIPDADYERHLNFLREQGYDVARLERVPQQPEADRAATAR